MITTWLVEMTHKIFFCFFFWLLWSLKEKERKKYRETMSMIVGENFRKNSTLIRNNLIIFSRKLFDGNIYIEIHT